METVNASKAIGAGFVATLVMTLMMYMAPMMGMPKMDIAAMLGSMFAGDMPQPWTGPWWTGMIIHFINGMIIFPLIYAYLLYPFLAGGNWLRGTEWGLILFVLAQAIVMPMMGMGFFGKFSPADNVCCGKLDWSRNLRCNSRSHCWRAGNPCRTRRGCRL